jgi:hypothetical protein
MQERRHFVEHVEKGVTRGPAADPATHICLRWQMWGFSEAGAFASVPFFLACP